MWSLFHEITGWGQPNDQIPETQERESNLRGGRGRAATEGKEPA